MINKTVIIINGTGGAGKDTFCDFIAKHYVVRNVSSIDPIKTLARAAGWDGRKDAKSRKLLSDLKRLFTEYNDLAFTHICEQHDQFIAAQDEEILFVHIREPEEIARYAGWVKEQGKAQCVTLLVTRSCGKTWGNASDDGVEGYTYDFVYHNDCPLEQMEADVLRFLKKEVFSKWYGFTLSKERAERRKAERWSTQKLSHSNLRVLWDSVSPIQTYYQNGNWEILVDLVVVPPEMEKGIILRHLGTLKRPFLSSIYCRLIPSTGDLWVGCTAEAYCIAVGSSFYEPFNYALTKDEKNLIMEIVTDAVTEYHGCTPKELCEREAGFLEDFYNPANFD